MFFAIFFFFFLLFFLSATSQYRRLIKVNHILFCTPYRKLGQYKTEAGVVAGNYALSKEGAI